MSIWIILHEYAEGVTPHLVRCRGKPGQTHTKKIAGKDFTPRAGDTLRVIGPYEYDGIPEVGKRKRREEEPEPGPEPFDPFEEDE